MVRLILEIDDEVAGWLEARAAEIGLSREEAAVDALRQAAAAAAGSEPSWRERDVLTCLRRMDGRPRRGVPVRSIFIHWAGLGGGRTNDDLFRGIDELAGRGWIERPDTDASDVVLTEAGHEAM